MQRFLALLLAPLLVSPVLAFEIPPESTQVIVGTAENWDSTYVTLRLHERTSD